MANLCGVIHSYSEFTDIGQCDHLLPEERLTVLSNKSIAFIGCPFFRQHYVLIIHFKLKMFSHDYKLFPLQGEIEKMEDDGNGPTNG